VAGAYGQRRVLVLPDVVSQGAERRQLEPQDVCAGVDLLKAVAGGILGCMPTLVKE